MQQQLVECLQGTLSPDSSIRSQAEQALLQLHSDRSCGLALINLILSSQVPSPTRQSAAVSLRKWLNERWSGISDGFVGFPPQGEPVRPEDKAPIRTALLQVLILPGRENRKLRVIGAACLSTVCSSDWPDDFPELLPSIQGMMRKDGQSAVSDEDRDRVHGALAFLGEFWQSEMDERQILGGAKDMLPTIEALLVDEQAYSPSLRCRCVLIFRQLLSSLFMVRDVYKDASKQIANELLPRWIEALVRLITPLDVAQQLSDGTVSDEDKHGWIALLSEIWRTLKIASHFRSQVKPYLPDLLRLAISTLQRLQGPFEAFHLFADAQEPFTVSDGDSDIKTTLPSLLCSIVDFIVEATRADRGRSVLITTSGASPEFQALLSSLISYSRITAEEEEEWSSDPDAFVAAIDEDGMEYGLRVACTDLIRDLLDLYQITALNALSQNIRQVCSGNQADWKSIEAALAVLGSAGEYVEEIKGNDDQSKFLGEIFQLAVLPTVQGQSPPLLTGRAYIFASQFASSLPEDLARQFVEASTQALEATALGSQEETLIVKLSAVRCVKNFYRRLPSHILAPFTNRIIAKLGPLLDQAEDDTLLLILETIQGIVSDDARGDNETSGGGISVETYGEIVSAVFHVWTNNVKDFILLSVVTDLLESLAAKKDAAVARIVVATAQRELVEAFASIAASGVDAQTSGKKPQSQTVGDDSDSDDDDPSQGLLEATMSVAEALLKGARPDALASCQTVEQLSGPIISALHSTQDRDVLQAGVGCLTSLVRKATSDVSRWQDASSTSSTTHYLQIISRLLSVDSESGGLKIGDFIITILRKMPESILPVLGDLLSTMVRRLATAQTAGFIQSLVLPFAFLLKENQTDVVCDLLLNVKTSNGATGMQVLAEKWMDNFEAFQGFWAQRISTIGVTRLLSTHQPFLQEIMVRGDLVMDTSNTIQTRSRSKARPEQYSMITFGQKMLKVLVHEVENASNGAPGAGGSGAGAKDHDDDDDGDDEGWGSDDDDEGPSSTNKPNTMLSDFLDSDLNDLSALVDGSDFGLEDGEEDLKEDEVWNMDFKSFLIDFLKSLAGSAGASELAGGLNGEEQKKLGAVLG